MSANRIFIHPTARAAFDAAGDEAGFTPVIVQTQGTATASKGTHESAGKYKDANGKLQSFSVCIDVSVNQKATLKATGKKIALDATRIKWFLYCLARHGFVAWLRTTAQGFDPHIHIVCAMLPLKGIPESQVIDFLNDRTGLASHKKETFWTANDDVDHHIARLFIAANPEAAGRVPVRYRG